MNSETVTATTTFIQTVGFPIAMCVIMLLVFAYVIIYMVKNHKEETQRFTESIDAMKEAFTKLSDKLDAWGKHDNTD